MYPSLGKNISFLLKVLYGLIAGSNFNFIIAKQDLNYNDLSQNDRRDFVKNASKVRLKAVFCKSVSGIILLLLKVFKTHHVLEFENCCAILSEQNCQLIFLKLLVSWFPSPATFLKMGRESEQESWLRLREGLPQLK